MDDLLRQRERELIANIDDESAYRSYQAALIRSGVRSENLAHFIIAARMLKAGRPEIADLSLAFNYDFVRSINEGLGLQETWNLCDYYKINYPVWRGENRSKETISSIKELWHHDIDRIFPDDQSFPIIYLTPQNTLVARIFLMFKQSYMAFFPELHVWDWISPSVVGLPDSCQDPRLFWVALEDDSSDWDSSNWDNIIVIRGGHGAKEINLRFGLEMAFEKRGWI